MTAVLLDTHAFLWYASGHPSLTPTARRAILSADAPYVSAASIWEARTKHRSGRLPIADDLVTTGLVHTLAEFRLFPLAVDVEDGELAGSFPQPHGDPFDRMLAAQAIRRGLALVSNDAALDAFGVTRVW